MMADVGEGTVDDGGSDQAQRTAALGPLEAWLGAWEMEHLDALDEVVEAARELSVGEREGIMVVSGRLDSAVADLRALIRAWRAREE